MIFTISRSSDAYRSNPEPSAKWQPFQQANWDEKMSNWTIDVKSLEDLLKIHKKFVVAAHKIPHIEIDDLT